MLWSYGVTTVPSRRDDLLPRTLQSLRAAGFDRPHLFVDGCDDSASWIREFGLNVTARSPKVRTAGHWVLSMYELYVRVPNADRFAVFQDDMIACSNLRRYLEKSPYPTDGYLNLLTFPSNASLVPDDHLGWFRSRLLGKKGKVGQDLQTGRGAVALVFDRRALHALLKAPTLVERPLDAHRGHRSIDGGIVTAMNLAGFYEYVHAPSLVQHVGHVSSMGNLPHPQSPTFPGETCDALSLIRQEVPA